MEVRPASAATSAAIRVLVPALEKTRTAYALIGRVALQVHCAATQPTENVDVALMTFQHVPRPALRGAKITYDHRSARSDNWRAPPLERGGPKVAIRFFAGNARLQRAIARAGLARLEGEERTVCVAMPEDLLILKLAAAEETSRRRAKRSADIGDILRLAHDYPEAAAVIVGFDRRLKLLRAAEEQFSVNGEDPADR